MDGITWASSAMEAAQSRLDIATQNLANLSSDGYRRRAARGFLTARGVSIVPVVTRQHGALRQTGRPFDLAIVGDGRFQIMRAGGRISQTRNGNFSRDQMGYLRDAAGGRLVGERGAVRVPSGAHIDMHGAVRIGDRRLDSIPLPAGSSLQSGALETSAVDPVTEMIDVLTAQRAYESAQKILTSIDETHKQANDIARTK